MTPAEALCILGSLADGIDPVTGDMLPETSEARASRPSRTGIACAPRKKEPRSIEGQPTETHVPILTGRQITRASRCGRESFSGGNA
ncbi:MAG: hypothetical protein DME37_08495 [Verrucomicrobia bacterium]|nr:MAG: hypothetical protein DME37_08495 [Verrucomicrobiota bacterium]